MSIKPPSIDGDPTAALLEIMAALRDPHAGCPWDLEQDFSTIAPYTIEEAYEVADAIRHGDMAALKSELGDLLLQVVYHAQMADEAGHFSFADVARSISEKMIRRHPHVFGNVDVDSAEEQTRAWEEMKARERHDADRVGVLADVPRALPALKRSVKLQKRAARVGFDWPHRDQVLEKLDEELRELREALADGAAQSHIREELGDLLFVMANLARHLDIDPEAALDDANVKFIRRFSRVETLLAEDGRTPDESTLDEMEAMWVRAKEEEREE